MKNKEFMTKVTRSFHKVGFGLKKHSPEILIAAGVVGTVASTVIACKATTKVSGILEEAKTGIDEVHQVLESPELQKRYIEKYGEEYTAEQSKKDLTIVYTQTGLKFIKLYAPAVILGTLSLGCIISSNNILRKRNFALAAAYATVDRSFKEYRNRVVDRFGKEVDKELTYNVQTKEVEETVTDKNGKEKTVKKKVKVAEPFGSDYTRCFCEGNPEWKKDAEFNHMFLRAQQQYANDLLVSRGYVFFNEVLEMLGFEPCTSGQVVGWLYNSDDKDSDNYIDFGIYDASDSKKRDFVNGDERSIWLNFNVDGIIYDRAFGTHLIK